MTDLMKKKHSRNYHRRSAEEIKQIIDLYESGLSLEQVGDEFRISKQRVEQIFKKAGIETRRFTKSEKYIAGQKNRRKILPKNLLLKYYPDRSLSIGDVLEKLNASRNSLYKSLEFHQIPKRIDEKLEYSPLTRQLLRRLYIEEDLTSTEIARRLDYAAVTVRNRLSALGIRKRDRKS